MSVETQKNITLSHAIKFLAITFAEGTQELLDYQEKFEALRSEFYTLSVRGPLNGCKNSYDKLCFIDEMRELKNQHQDVLHIFPPLDSSIFHFCLFQFFL